MNHKSRGWLLFFPAIVLGIWGFLGSRPKPPVRFDKSHIQSEVIEQMTRRLSGQTWRDGWATVTFKNVYVMPAKGNKMNNVSYFVLQKDRIKILILVEGVGRVRGQSAPLPVSTVTELHLKREKNSSVFVGGATLPGYGFLPVSFSVETTQT